MRHTKQEKQQAIDYLRDILKPGDTVYTVLRHVSRSGMLRAISPIIVSGNKQPNDLTYWVSLALGWGTDDDNGGIKVTGCGMDAGFHLVHNLSYVLYPDSFECIGENCPSNDHVNGDRNREPHRHSSGGYALYHRWL